MTPIDTAARPGATPQPGTHREPADTGRGRQFARCVSAAERRVAAEAPSAQGAETDPAQLAPALATAPAVTAVGAFAQAQLPDGAAAPGAARADAGIVRAEGGATSGPSTGPDGPPDPRADGSAQPPARHAEAGPGAPRRRAGEAPGGEEPAAVAPEPGRSQTGAASVEAPPPARGPDGDAARLARAMLSALPDAGAAERSLTVSFPAAAGGVVERMVLTVSGGVIEVVVTARAQQRERVAAALPELARLMRSRGLRVGAVGLG
jgi:hypothetical protein